jgi:hypothetical protein
MIEQRLSQLPQLASKYKLLPASKVIDDIKSLIDLINSDQNLIHSSQAKDVSDIDSKAEVLDWFQTLGIQDHEVDVYWISSQEGIHIEYANFVLSYDDLWYPGADDVWVTDSARTWVLELNHEEIFSFYQKRFI